ncbi:MAG: pyridoxamine 5'-phosphate oxidase family protein [Marinobacter sp.]|uniref:pyridoxamine 5'-phosphate oxidase family protein n=1 Tax=Marinobacter sp. TaxID=50741 RepID=UPI003C409D7C
MKLTSIEQVQKRVGSLPAPRDLKVIDHVDEHARRWLSYANFAFIGFGKAGTIRLTPAGGERAFATVMDAGHVQIPLAALDDGSLVEPDLSFGALFMVSGMDETLRVNGKVSHIADGKATLKVEECYLHCAKSFRRSDFWLPSSTGPSQGAPSDYIRQSRFLVLASINSSGEADVSPKGDPEHLLIQEEEGVVYFADRPGNRRIDSFRNILEQPEVSVLALLPGCHDVLEFRGKAELCVDDHLLQRFEIHGKKPKLIIKIPTASLRVRPSPAITNSALWPSKKGPADLVPSDIFKAHVQRSKDSSLKAKVARAAVSLPGAMEKGLELDYKKNLY